MMRLASEVALLAAPSKTLAFCSSHQLRGVVLIQPFGSNLCVSISVTMPDDIGDKGRFAGAFLFKVIT
jgi:hypothetical protein